MKQEKPILVYLGNNLWHIQKNKKMTTFAALEEYENQLKALIPVSCPQLYLFHFLS